MGNTMDRELIEEKFKGVHQKIESNQELTNQKIDNSHELVIEKLDKILLQTTITNGRVTKLENETRFFRTISRYPKATLLSGIGLVVVVMLLGLQSIFKIF